MVSSSIKQIHFVFDKGKFTSSLYPLFSELPSGAEKFRNFFDLWIKLSTESKIPTRRDFTFESLVGWHSSIRIIQIGPTVDAEKRTIIRGDDYQRYWGKHTMISQINDMGGKSIKAKEKYNDFLETFHKGNYAFSVGYAPNDDSSLQKIMWLDLPLSSDGKTIDHLITALLPIYN